MTTDPAIMIKEKDRQIHDVIVKPMPIIHFDMFKDCLPILNLKSNFIVQVVNKCKTFSIECLAGKSR